MKNESQDIFFELLRAGLWEKECRLTVYNNIDWSGVYKIAQEQSVIGLILAGIEHSDIKPPQGLLLQWIGEVQMIEQRNKAMNEFLARMIEGMRKAGIYTVLVKGQGIAQCYERPLWRTAGDIDLLASDDNYPKAIEFLKPMASNIEDEILQRRHLGMTIESWIVELHGTLHGSLWKGPDEEIDNVQKAVFYEGKVRSWMNGRTQIFLPHVDEDVFFVFTHILQHFYVEGIGLRQICDWCRLLFTYKDVINAKLLEERLKAAHLMTEWGTFAAFAVEYLGMDASCIPLYKESHCYKIKAKSVLALVMENGNFGQGRDKSYKEKHSKAIRYMISFGHHGKDVLRRFWIFPRHSFAPWWRLMMKGASGI